jgi:hypothetical protein
MRHPGKVAHPCSSGTPLLKWHTLATWHTLTQWHTLAQWNTLTQWHDLAKRHILARVAHPGYVAHHDSVAHRGSVAHPYTVAQPGSAAHPRGWLPRQTGRDGHQLIRAMTTMQPVKPVYIVTNVLPQMHYHKSDGTNHGDHHKGQLSWQWNSFRIHKKKISKTPYFNSSL